MDKLTRTVLDRPVAAIVCVMALLIFGLSSIKSMPMELYPETNYPMLFVTTIYPQAGPEEMERLITEKIEESCGTLPNLKTMTSSSGNGTSDVTFQFAYGTDLSEARTRLLEALEDAKIEFPEGVASPTVVSMNSNADAAISISVSAKDGKDIYPLVKQKLIPELKKIGEAAAVKFYGGSDTYISIELFPERLAQYGLDIASVSEAVSTANMELATGNVKYGPQDLTVSSRVQYTDIEAIKNIPVTLGSGETIHLYDIALVHYAAFQPESVSRFNGSANVSIDITKKQSSNVIALSKEVKSVLEAMGNQYPDLDIQIIFDSSDNILASIKSIAQTLILGILLSMLVLFVFFGDFKASLIVSSSMPISLLVTFILMSKMGFSLNLITMSALVIGIGMMVDNAIVVVEMCFRKRDDGFDFKEAAAEGTKLVTTSIIASTLTSVVVYLPLTGLKGMSGQLYSSLGYTIVFALMASLVSALTLIPLCFSKYKPVEKKELPINRLLSYVSEAYGKLMEKLLPFKAVIAVIAFALLILSGFLATKIHMELMEATDEKQVEVTLTFKPGLGLEAMDEVTKHVEEFVKEQPDVLNYSAMVTKETSSATINAYINKKSRLSTAQIADQWNKALAGYDNRCDIKAALADPEGMGNTGGSVVEIVLKSTDLEELKAASRQVEKLMGETNGVLSVQNTIAQGGFQAEIRIDPERARSRGFTPAELAELLNQNVSGKKAAAIRMDDKKYDIRVELPMDQREDLNDVKNMMVLNPEGVSVPLSEVADIEFRDTPQTITRTNSQFEGSIKATVPAALVYELEETINAGVEQLSFSGNVTRGQTMAEQSMEEEFGGIGQAIFAAVFLVFMVMAIQFESMRFSILVMFCIPFSLIGSILLLLATNSKINMTSLMGFLMLAGIVVNNGILLIDTTNEYKKEMPVEEALIKAGKSRLRPILMTTLTTVLSMFPMVIPHGGSEDAMKGMAIVIIGGLTASTILAFILLPAFYLFLVKKTVKTAEE